jgi:hypothetical protein
MARASVGALLTDSGNLQEAGRTEAEAAAALARTLGPRHPHVLRCQANLLLTRHQSGDTEAVVQRRAVIDELARLLGEDHASVGTLRSERRLMHVIDPQPC